MTTPTPPQATNEYFYFYDEGKSIENIIEENKELKEFEWVLKCYGKTCPGRGNWHIVRTTKEGDGTTSKTINEQLFMAQKVYPPFLSDLRTMLSLYVVQKKLEQKLSSCLMRVYETDNRGNNLIVQFDCGAIRIYDGVENNPVPNVGFWKRLQGINDIRRNDIGCALSKIHIPYLINRIPHREISSNDRMFYGLYDVLDRVGRVKVLSEKLDVFAIKKIAEAIKRGGYYHRFNSATIDENDDRVIYIQ